jgi:hypothetical protein
VRRPGDSSFKWTGMTPRAPWTITCIRKAPIASHTSRTARGWFTEGFDTRDLKKAKALFYELA